MVSVLSVGSAPGQLTLGNMRDMLTETTHGGGWSPNQLLWALEIFFSVKLSNQKKSFPPLALEMRRIPLLSLCTGLVSTYSLSSPMALAWPQPTFKPIHISGEGSPRVFISCRSG